MNLIKACASLINVTLLVVIIVIPYENSQKFFSFSTHIFISLNDFLFNVRVITVQLISQRNHRIREERRSMNCYDTL